jgi:4-amino-4-deoxy-L-arabinose transferase-like glycosyltransferase
VTTAPPTAAAATADVALPVTIARSFLPSWVPDAVIRRVPIALILVIQAVVSISLVNVAWADEGLYMFAGHQEIAHLLHGVDISQFGYGKYFSGAPALYPVLAAALDTVGGLQAARLFSTVCMLTASISVYLITKALFGRRAAFLALCVFAFAGPILFLGHYATYDAMTLALLAAAGAVLTRYAGYRSAVVAGLLLGLAMAVKYAGALWVPSVMLLGLIPHRQGSWRKWLRPKAIRLLVTALTMIVLIGTALAVWGQLIWQGILFTTTARVAQIPVSDSYLLGVIATDAGPQLVLAAAGAVLLVKFRRSWFTALLLLGSAFLAPLHQIQIDELAALHKHVGFGLIFAAPLAGYALAQLPRWNKFYGTLAAGIIVVGVTMMGRSDAGAIMDIPKLNQPLLDEIKALTSSPVTAQNKNVLVAIDANAVMYYHQDDNPQISWDAYSSADLIHQGYYSIIVFNNIVTHIDQVDARNAQIIEAVTSTPGYRLAYSAPLRPGFRTFEWSIYVKA